MRRTISPLLSLLATCFLKMMIPSLISSPAISLFHSRLTLLLAQPLFLSESLTKSRKMRRQACSQLHSCSIPSNIQQICPNLHFLGKRSTTKTSEGIKIVTLGGRLDETIVGGLSKEQYLPFHTVGDAKALHGANSADILLTTTWPALIRNGSKIPLAEGVMLPIGQEHIA